MGKTVLLDHLTRAAYQAGYQLPQQSQSKETGTIRTSSSRILINVVPGQQAPPRYVALQDLFRGKTPVHGVVHVVSWGHATLSSREIAESLLRDRGADTIEKARRLHLDSEIKDFAETCQQIRDAHHLHQMPTWLLLAVDKVDLYQDRIEAARQWYTSPGGPFGTKLAELQHQLGTDYFRWEIVPVCAALETFEWNGQDLRSPDESGILRTSAWT